MTSSLVGSEMCIRDRLLDGARRHKQGVVGDAEEGLRLPFRSCSVRVGACLLYTSDAADDM
eukprot:3941827-Prorocentrum_lima.AAC.1